MGSFSTTCAVSGLPIQAREPVRFLLLTENPHSDWALSYPHSIWLPRTWPLRALYNDYGGVEEVEDGATRRAWMDVLKMDLVELPVGENEYHDLATSKDMPFEKFLKALWKNRVFVRRAGHMEQLKVRQAFIREDVWQGLKSISLTEVPSYDSPIDFQIFKKAIESMRRIWGRLTTPFSEAHHTEVEIRAVMEEILSLAPPFLPNEVPSTRTLNAHFNMLANLRRTHVMTETEATSFLDMAEEFLYINYVLGLSRYWWRPSYAIGPQFGEWHLHQEINQIFADISRGKFQAEELDS